MKKRVSPVQLHCSIAVGANWNELPSGGEELVTPLPVDAREDQPHVLEKEVLDLTMDTLRFKV